MARKVAKKANKNTTTVSAKRKGSSRVARKQKKTTGKGEVAKFEGGPVAPAGAPTDYRVRVRMYRHGLGDCFLLTFPRRNKPPFQVLIDCGALDRKSEFMTSVVEHIRNTILADGAKTKARLDVVVATHEHLDHLSGFNQARSVFDQDFDIGAVWLGWTEDLSKPEIKKIKQTKDNAKKVLQEVLDKLPPSADRTLTGLRADVTAMSQFNLDTSDLAASTIGDALEYLKARGKKAGDLQFLEPGHPPLSLNGVEGVNVYVLGPPKDPTLLKRSEVTQQVKNEDVVYHLSSTGMAGIEALSAATTNFLSGASQDTDRNQPFSSSHQFPIGSKSSPGELPDNLKKFISTTYNAKDQEWRKIDYDWLLGVGQLALDLDSDTNNSSLVLAFEFEETKEVLLFVGDAQVGNWLSWANVEFDVPGRKTPLPAHDLLRRTVFYKVGHHASHNATLKRGGLELMTSDQLVAFIPLDCDTAAKKGEKGWDMPAKPLFAALNEATNQRVVISDVREKAPKAAIDAGIFETTGYIDYYLE